MAMTRTLAHPTEERAITLSAGDAQLDGELSIPARARAMVIFAHGTGSSRFSPRNRFVARVLREGGLGTLLFDLLTPVEEAEDSQTSRLRFDMNLLAGRLIAATDCLAESPDTRELQVGYFGASSGAGAALLAASLRPEKVGAVVSRGGRPDLAGRALGKVLAPTLLIVGSMDEEVLALNREAWLQIRAPKQLEIVSGATHLFEEPGALEKVACLARDWFLRYLDSPRGR